MTQSAENFLLDIVGILIFVHQDLPELCPQFADDLFIFQQFEGVVLQVAEVQQAPAQLFLRKPLGKRAHQAAHRLCHGGHDPAFRPDGGSGLKEIILPQGGDALQKPFPAALDPFQKGFVLVPASRQAALIKGLQAGIGPIPAFVHSGPKLTAKGLVFRQQRAILRPDLRHSFRQAGGLIKVPQGVVQPTRCLLPDAVQPLQALRVRQAQHRQQFQQLFRVGMAAEFFMHIQYRLGQHPVGPAVGERVAQGGKPRLPLPVSLLQGVVQRLLQQQGALGLVGQAEVRLHAAQGKVLPDEALAKGVNRLDAGCAQQAQLPPQMDIVRLFRQTAAQLVADPLAHLPRRRVGKGHHQQLVHTAGVRGIGEQAQHPPDQHGGLAGAGGGGHDQASIPAIHRQLLLLGQFDAHVRTSSCCSSCSRISWTLAGLSTGKNRSLSFFSVGSKWQASRKSQKRHGVSSRPVR